MRDGTHSAPSNADFDASLKERNSSWGVRDLADLERVAETLKFSFRELIEMPSSNAVIVFSKDVG